ncbi:MAG: metal-dependent hydrolase [Pseudomonadota bacterium]
MSPITHMLVGWVGLERFQLARRDKAIVVLAGLTPDLDGLGIVVDFATRTFGLAETDYYQAFHRMYGHGLTAAVLIAALAAACGVRRWRVACCAFVSVHLHFLCDLIGSRGTTAEDIWGIYYLTPFSKAYPISWSGQWPLVGWQNMLVTAVLLAITLRRASNLGYSPLGMISESGDKVFVATLRKWRAQLWPFLHGKN